MKVTVKTKTPERRLVAVVALNDMGVFLKSNNGSVYYVNRKAEVSTSVEKLEVLATAPKRTPVYEGDTIEIAF